MLPALACVWASWPEETKDISWEINLCVSCESVGMVRVHLGEPLPVEAADVTQVAMEAGIDTGRKSVSAWPDADVSLKFGLVPLFLAGFQ